MTQLWTDKAITNEDGQEIANKSSITADELLAVGAYDMHWNPNYKGGFHEYGLPASGVPFEYGSIFIAVNLDERCPGCAVTIRGNMTQIPCPGAKTVGDVLALQVLLGGECSIVDTEIDERLQSDGRTYADGCAP